MGLDLYAGTLTRYYANNWKTVTQQWAESNGMTFHAIRPEDQESQEDQPDVAAIHQTLIEWRDTIIRGISPQDGPLYEAWDENNEADYYTDKPDWDAYGALLLYGACRKYGETLPATVAKGWDYNNHPVMQRVYQDEAINWTLFTGAEWWLPIANMFAFRCTSPNGSEIVVGTAGSLLAELNRINELGWQAEESEIISWTATEGYPVDGEFIDGKYRKLAENNEYNTESLAKFAFSIFYQAAQYSLANQVPIIMDY